MTIFSDKDAFFNKRERIQRYLQKALLEDDPELKDENIKHIIYFCDMYLPKGFFYKPQLKTLHSSDCENSQFSSFQGERGKYEIYDKSEGKLKLVMKCKYCPFCGEGGND